MTSRIDLHPDASLDAQHKGSLVVGEERRRLVEHMRVCSSCALEHLARRDFAPELEPRPEDTERVMRLATRILDEPFVARAVRPDRLRMKRWGMLAGVIAAALSLGIAAASLYRSVASRPSVISAPASSRELRNEGVSVPAVTSARASQADSVMVAPPVAASSMAADGLLPSPALPPTAAELFAQAGAARGRGDALGAARLYQELMTRYPQSREALVSHVSLGRIYLHQLGNAQAARTQFDDYLRASPGGALADEARAGRALCSGRMGRTAEELAAWKQLLEAHPNSSYAPRARERIRALEGRD
jgi:tetratricopeptide (TPR) repeat protein